MEGLNPELMKLAMEHFTMRNTQKSHAPKSGDNDIYGFPFEPAECFSTDPLEFEESAMRLQMEAIETFRLLSNANRHSPLFYKLSAELEKLVGLLGGVCITKAVLEHQEGKSFPMLDTLTTNWLREKAAFNFRKCYSSYMESMSHLLFNRNALSLSIRWAALDKRLIATGEKIEMIKAGKVKVDLSRKEEQAHQHAETLHEMKENTVPHRESEETASSGFSAKGRAFPVDRSAFSEPDQIPGSSEGSDCGELSAQNENVDTVQEIHTSDTGEKSAIRYDADDFRESGLIDNDEPHQCPDTPGKEKASSDREELCKEQNPARTGSRREILTPVYSDLYDDDYDDEDWPDDEDPMYDESEREYDRATLIRGLSEFSRDPDLMTKLFQRFTFTNPP